MSFTYNLATTAGQLRLLVGDTDATDVQLQDEEIAAIINIEPDSLFLEAAMCCDSMASRAAVSQTDIVIGSLQVQDRYRVQELKSQAKRWRDMENDTPAFAIAEQNLSDFNALIIIRNFVLRTTP